MRRLRYILRPRRDGTITLDYWWKWGDHIRQKRGFHSEAEAMSYLRKLRRT
jgi:hypothetical protein